MNYQTFALTAVLLISSPVALAAQAATVVAPGADEVVLYEVISLAPLPRERIRTGVLSAPLCGTDGQSLAPRYRPQRLMRGDQNCDGQPSE